MRILEIVFEHKNTVVFEKLSGFPIGSRLSDSCGCDDGCRIDEFSIVYSRNMGYGSASCFENSAAGTMEDVLVFWFCGAKYFCHNGFWGFGNFWLNDFWLSDFRLDDFSNNFRFDDFRFDDFGLGDNRLIFAGSLVVLESSSRFADFATAA